MNDSAETKTGILSKGDAPLLKGSEDRDARPAETRGYVARLETARTLERPVQCFGASSQQLAALCRKWLEAHGESGDVFVMSEILEREVGRFTK